VVHEARAGRRRSIVAALRHPPGHAFRSTPPIESARRIGGCRRSNTVAGYQERFLALLTRAGPLTEAQQIQLFTAGLGEPLSINVQL